MTLQLPHPDASLNEPKRSGRPISHSSNNQPEESDARMEKTWLSEQLLAGKNYSTRLMAGGTQLPSNTSALGA